MGGDGPGRVWGACDGSGEHGFGGASMRQIKRRHQHYADARTDLERLAEPASQLTIFDGTVKLAPCLWMPNATYTGALDGDRLTSQLQAVQGLMQDGTWRTLGEIRAALGRGSEAGLSARLRESRTRHAGGWTVERRRRGDPRHGLWEYRLHK